MERTGRLVVISSVLVAVGAYLLCIRVAAPRDALLALLLTILGGVGARLAPVWTGRLLLALGFVAPALLSMTLGGIDTQFRTMWLAPLAAWLALAAPTAPWSVQGPFRPIVIVWALVVAACWPIVFVRELDFTPSLLSSLTSNGLAREPIWLWAYWVASTALMLLAGILWFDRLFARYRNAPRPEMVNDVLLPVAAGVVAASAVACYQSWVDPTRLSTVVWMEMKRAPGTLLDANALGIMAATWSVVFGGLLWSWRRGPFGAWCSVAALAVGWLAVFASGSRTAFAAVLIGSFALLHGALRTGGPKRWKVAAAGLLIAAVIAAALIIGGFRTASPLQRLAATLPAPTAAGVRAFAVSMWHRDGWGSASAAAIAEHPLTGVGVGTFNQQSVDYYFRLTGGGLVPDNAQNWWRHQVAEWGIVGAVIAVAWTILVALLLLRGRAKPEDRVAAAGVRGAIAGLALASLFGVPSQVPVVSVSFWTFVFLAVYLLGATPESKEWRWSRLATSLVVLFAVTTQAYAATHDLRPPARAQLVGKDYGHGFRRGGVDESGEPFWWTGRKAVFVFSSRPGQFEFRAAPMHPDIAQEPVRVEIWMGNHKVIDRVADDHTPFVLRIPVRPGDRAVFLETRVSRTFSNGGGRALGLRIQKAFKPEAK